METQKRRRTVDLMTVGFALFAMFFGAGNLIFPPHLGVFCGYEWWLGFLLYFAADCGLAVLAVIAMVRLDGKIERVAEPLGRIPSLLLATAIIVCIGPGLAIPRTAATTFELAVIPLFGVENAPLPLFILSVIFFIVVMLLAIRPGKVVDIVGNFLTPILLISLAVLIIKGLTDPAAPIGAPLTDSVVREGLYNGYQTLDMLGAIFFSILVIASIRGKGYSGTRAVSRMAFLAAMLSAVLLFLVYGGLTWLGARNGAVWKDVVFSGDLNQAGLLINITKQVLGGAGNLVLALAVASACLTTAIGTVSATSEYFEKLFHGKISYKKLVIIICVLSAAVCNLGLSQIISVSAPVLMVLFPVTILMIATVFLRGVVRSTLPYRAAAVVTLVISLMDVLGNHFGIAPLAAANAALPLAQFGFSWLLPAAGTFLLLFLVTKNKTGAKELSAPAPVYPGK